MKMPHRKSEASDGPILIPANTPADICINFPSRTKVAIITYPMIIIMVIMIISMVIMIISMMILMIISMIIMVIIMVIMILSMMIMIIIMVMMMKNLPMEEDWRSDCSCCVCAVA